jgi:hypothetical protein
LATVENHLMISSSAGHARGFVAGRAVVTIHPLPHNLPSRAIMPAMHEDHVREAGLAFIRTEGQVTRLRVHGRSALARFIQIAIAAGCAATMVAVILTAFRVPLILALLICYALAFIPTVILATRRHASVAAGHQDIIIDRERAIISLPARFRRTAPLSIPMQQITDITWADELEAYDDVWDTNVFGPRRYVRKDMSRPGDPALLDHRSEMVFAVLFCWTDESGVAHEAPAASSHAREHMIALAHLLRRELGFESRISDSVSG